MGLIPRVRGLKCQFVVLPGILCTCVACELIYLVASLHLFTLLQVNLLLCLNSETVGLRS
jgi:hypothetical protein